MADRILAPSPMAGGNTWTNYLLDARTVLECAREHVPSSAERAGLERAILQIDRLLLVATAYRGEATYYQQDRQ